MTGERQGAFVGSLKQSAPDSRKIQQYPCISEDAGAHESSIAVRGREGSKAVYHKKINDIADVTNAEIKKLLGIAKLLPAEAFDALFDPETIELMLNPDGKVWRETLGGGMTHICDMRESDAEEFIRQIAGYLKKVVTRENPLLEGILPLDDSRFAGQLYPVVSHPAIAIRRRAVRVFSLEDYIASGVMTEAQCASIRRAVGERQNIVIVGGTSSGKTTLGNTVLNEITLADPAARQIIIEDTAELNSTAVNKVNFQVSPDTTLLDLLKTALRMRPDRIIVGEVRGAEAFGLLQAWNTGHPGGLTTLHANDCVSGLRRLKSLVSQHPFAPRDIEPDIALAVNVLVNIVKTDCGRRVNEIVAVGEYDPTQRENNGYKLEAL